MKIVYKFSFSILIISLVIFFTGFLGHGGFWGIKTAFGYGGGGGGGGGGSGTPINTNRNQPIVLPTFTIEPVQSPTANSTVVLKGTKSTSAIIYLNNSGENITYLSETAWESTRSLVLGINVFTLIARDSIGNSSSPITVMITRQQQIDLTGDNQIDDLDLAKLVSNWGKNYNEGDFNKDGVIDDLDLAYLVSRWSV